MANLIVKVPVGTKARIAAISGSMGIFPQDAKTGSEVSINLNNLATLSAKNLKALTRVDATFFWSKYKCIKSADDRKRDREDGFRWTDPKTGKESELFFPIWEADKTSDYAVLEEDASIPQPTELIGAGTLAPSQQD